MNLTNFISLVEPYTMTSVERITELYNSLEYIRINNIKGDIVECGVWKGGNILGCLEYMRFHRMDNSVWLYDTFEGMTETTEHDVDFNNNSGEIWIGRCDSTISEVKKIVNENNYPENKINFIVGDVSKTLLEKENIPECISLLRLDTDWYKSTKDELDFLYPKLITGGVLIVDDYGHWKGSKKAVDEYFKSKGLSPKINFIDYTGIKIIK